MSRRANMAAWVAGAALGALLPCAPGLAFEPVVIKGVEFVAGLPMPAHHGIRARIKAIEDPNLTAFKAFVSSDGGQTWILYDDAIRPYNAEAINLTYRGRLYALSTGVQYKLMICAVYGTVGQECGTADIKLPVIMGDRTLDEDGDRLSREFEYNRGLDPLNPDSDDDDMSDRVELSYSLDPNLSQLPELEVVSRDLNFGDGDPYGDLPGQHQAAIIRNSGSRPLRIFNTLISSSPEGAFKVSDNYNMITELKPGNEAAIAVDFLPKAPGAASGQIALLTDDRRHFPEEIKLTGFGRGVSNMYVDFGYEKIFFDADVGDVESRTIPVKNLSADQPLKVTAHIRGSPTLVVVPDSLVIEPGGNSVLKPYFYPDWIGSHSGVLNIQGVNDASLSTVDIPISAWAENGEAPRARVSTGLLAFPATRITDESSAYLSIHNDGEGYLYVMMVDLGADEEALPAIGGRRVFTPSSKRLVVPPRSNRPLRVTFRPNSVASYSSQLCIVTNDPAVGTSTNCDVPRTLGGVAWLPNEAIRIQLTGEGIR